MPADASIYSTLQAPRINTPFESLSQILQLRNQQQAAQGLQEQRQALAAQERERTEGLAKQNEDRAALQDALSKATTPDEAIGLLRQGGHGDLIATVQKQFSDADEYSSKARKAKLEAETAERDYFGHLAASVKSWEKDGPEAMTTAAQAAIQHAKKEGHDVSQWEQTLQQNPQALPRLLDGVIAYAQGPQAPKAPVSVAPGATLVQPETGKALYTAPEKVQKPTSAQEYEYAKTQGYQGTYEQYQNEDANRKRPVTNVMMAQTDPKGIADAVMRGDLPPDISQYGRQVQGAVASELAARGYHLSTAQLDWKATQKHIASLNSTQQLRLNQAIGQLPDLLDSVDALASQWKAGRFPILNRANLAAAKGGAYGKDAASIATQLDAQIADVTGDLGAVYMGGNSPTDHSLDLAGKALRSDWDEKVLHDMVALARKNVVTRRNSINSTGVSGASANNPYAPPATPPPAGAESPEHRFWRLNGKQGPEPK